MQDVLPVKQDVELFNVREVARMTNSSVATVYNWMNAGDLGFIKLGKSRRISKDALKEFIAKNTHSAK